MTIKVDNSKCTGCRMCELVCTMKHYKVFNPTKAFIKVDISTENPSVNTCPCEEKPCIKQCPADALSISKLRCIVVDKEKCISCGTCENICPYGIIRLENEFPVTCDLCGGNPECVKYCTLEALRVK